ncbi:hypothetical protein STXM2123_4226 [Streptomyces sp. F-3]|nr:hypothetical protein STXM2123_4226 [Streptomyces sp. F-3]
MSPPHPGRGPPCPKRPCAPGHGPDVRSGRTARGARALCTRGPPSSASVPSPGRSRPGCGARAPRFRTGKPPARCPPPAARGSRPSPVFIPCGGLDPLSPVVCTEGEGSSPRSL